MAITLEAEEDGAILCSLIIMITHMEQNGLVGIELRTIQRDFEEGKIHMINANRKIMAVLQCSLQKDVAGGKA